MADWPLLNAMLNAAGGATWVSIHHGGGVGMGYSQHAGVVIVCDGTEAAARRIERVLWNDPATGVMRHADAGYADAIAARATRARAAEPVTQSSALSSASRAVRILTPRDYRVMPWKNGGGTTTEIYIHPEGAGWDDFEWRVGIADIRNRPVLVIPGDRSSDQAAECPKDRECG